MQVLIRGHLYVLRSIQQACLLTCEAVLSLVRYVSMPFVIFPTYRDIKINVIQKQQMIFNNEN